MSTNTEFLGLIKPAQEDFYNIDDFNQNFQKIDDFAKRKDNPHNVTAEQIGAAPSGYGLGTNIVFTENANTIIATGFYYTNVNTPSGAWSYINHYQYPTIGYAFQSAYSVDAKVQCSRRCVEGTWGEWEYENPPMMPGVEYRTTKRHNGHPVYTKLINFGALSNASVNIGTSSVISLYGFTTWVYTTDNNALYHDTFPVFGTNGNLYAVAYIRNNDLCVKCFDTSGGIENYTAQFIIEYTK